MGIYRHLLGHAHSLLSLIPLIPLPSLPFSLLLMLPLGGLIFLL